MCGGVSSSFHQSLLSLCGKEIQLTLFTHENIYIFLFPLTFIKHELSTRNCTLMVSHFSITTISGYNSAYFITTENWKWKSLSHVWLCDLVHYTVHGILQARILEWVAFPFSRGSSQPKDQTHVSCIAGRFFTSWATKEALMRRKSVESESSIHYPLLVARTKSQLGLGFVATHSSILAWKIPWTEEPGRLQSMGLQRVGHDWASSLHLS